MPRQWGAVRRYRIDPGQLEPATIRQIFKGLYGLDWRHRLAGRCGVSMRRVDEWASGRAEMPAWRMRLLLEWAEDRQRYTRMRRRLQAALEEELAYREAAGRWAERWLRLMVEAASRK